MLRFSFNVYIKHQFLSFGPNNEIALAFAFLKMYNRFDFSIRSYSTIENRKSKSGFYYLIQSISEIVFSHV